MPQKRRKGGAGRRMNTLCHPTSGMPIELVNDEFRSFLRDRAASTLVKTLRVSNRLLDKCSPGLRDISGRFSQRPLRFLSTGQGAYSQFRFHFIVRSAIATWREVELT